jgi:hypothetical protein
MQFKASCSYDEFVAGARTMITFVGNVVSNPTIPKFRKVRPDLNIPVLP